MNEPDDRICESCQRPVGPDGSGRYCSLRCAIRHHNRSDADYIAELESILRNNNARLTELVAQLTHCKRLLER